MAIQGIAAAIEMLLSKQENGAGQLQSEPSGQVGGGFFSHISRVCFMFLVLLWLGLQQERKKGRK